MIKITLQTVDGMIVSGIREEETSEYILVDKLDCLNSSSVKCIVDSSKPGYKYTGRVTFIKNNIVWYYYN